MGLAALIIGIFSILVCGIPMSFGGLGILLGLLAIILGILGRRRLLEEGRSSGVAIGGLVAGVIGLLGGISNLVLCLACFGIASSADEAAEEQGVAWAEQQAQQLAQQAVPMVPATPSVATPPSQPAVPATPPAAVAARVINLDTPVPGMFAPGLPTDAEGKPYMDYTLNITSTGQYTITLQSPNSANYDPFLRLMQNGTQLEEDDDGGGFPNAQISRTLNPGTYIVRATSYTRGQLQAMAPFMLSVTGG